MRIAVLTPAIPERGQMLAEAIASVAAQTRAPDLHLVLVDHERNGCAVAHNRMLAAALAAGCDYVALLADDDVLYPNHLEVLAAAADGAEVVYSWCDVEGRDWNPNADFDPDRLTRESYIPGTALLHAKTVATLGGWRADAAFGWEDWDLYKRLLAAGKRFVCVPEVTWKYRFHGTNASWRAA